MRERHEPLDKPLTKAELENHSRVLSAVGAPNVRRMYLKAYEECRMEGDELPQAAAIQRLVAAWKMMRKHRQNRQPDRHG
ncbi:MAG: hypothetical protein J0H49_10560 [Acidobacteria bacterium]|nr:hypothetical protein [Acidobacteriota bacterium]